MALIHRSAIRTNYRTVLFLAALGLSGIVFISGCKKNNDYSSSTGCITRDVPLIGDKHLGEYFNQSEYDSTLELFQKNNISRAVYQPTVFTHALIDSAGLAENLVGSTRFINGLPVYQGGVSFQFTNKIFADSTSYGYNGVLLTNDTAAQLTIDQVRKKFLDSKPDKYTYQNLNGKKVTHWADSCIVATLIYRDSDMTGNSSSSSRTFVLTWSIHQSANDYNVTLATIADATGVVTPTPVIRVID